MLNTLCNVYSLFKFVHGRSNEDEPSCSWFFFKTFNGSYIQKCFNNRLNYLTRT